MPLVAGFINQVDRRQLQQKWSGDARAYEAELWRRRNSGNKRRRTILACVAFWILLMALGGVTVGGTAVAILLHGGLGLALLAWGVFTFATWLSDWRQETDAACRRATSADPPGCAATRLPSGSR
ncbi:hypothetical protein Ait01nite_057320 [Actinoplanes italicus]|nr:hypothetical protein Ait01nite_057320 [Actinoplanes italicus]